MTSAKSGLLRVGAAKVDITPPADALPSNYKSIHDRVFARAIVLDNGHTRAVLIGADVVGFNEEVYANLTERISEHVGCPVEQILMSGTHTHASPRPGRGRYTTTFTAADAQQGERVQEGTFEAVQRAYGCLQPAQVGYGSGQCYLNVNRDAIHPETRTWYQGPNLDGPSDKTVAVVKFEDLSGEPIAVYVNYAMHANMMYMRNEISGGFPGAMSRYIEELYDDQAVAIWTAGAGGDQNPLYLRLAEPAIVAQKRAQFVAAGGDPMDIHGLARFTDVQLDQKILDLNARLVNSIGQLLGEEVIRVMHNTTRTSSEARIWGALHPVSCPGRRRVDHGREGAPGTYEDAAPIEIRLGLLVIGSIALVAVSGEPYNVIAQRLKRAAPYGQTVLVTVANGASAGYIPDDASYVRHTFQVLGTRIKPGCAEEAIVGAVLEMMDQSLSG